MQNIIPIKVYLDMPTKVPSNGKPVLSTFIGNALCVYYLVDGEADWSSTIIFKLVNPSLELSVPDGFTFIDTVARRNDDRDTLLLFGRM